MSNVIRNPWAHCVLFLILIAALSFYVEDIFQKQYVFLFGFSVLAISAVISDIRRYIIPNAIVVSILLLFFISRVFLPGGTDWTSHFGAAAAVFLVGMVMSELRVFGAGDLKLFTAIALWFGFGHLWQLTIYTALFGGAFAVLVIFARYIFIAAAVRFEWWNVNCLPRLISKGALPYGLPIALSGIIIMSDIVSKNFLN